MRGIEQKEAKEQRGLCVITGQRPELTVSSFQYSVGAVCHRAICLSRNDAEAAAMGGLQHKKMFVQKVGSSGPLVRSPTNGRASRASLPKSANSEPVTIRPYGRDGRARWKNRTKPRFYCVFNSMNPAKP